MLVRSTYPRSVHIQRLLLKPSSTNRAIVTATRTDKTPRNQSQYKQRLPILKPPYYTSERMSYSNTETGGQAADPCTSKNKEEQSLSAKMTELTGFIDSCKFCMMTTRSSDSNLLASRCMALAAKEGNGADLIFHSNSESGKTDDLAQHPDVNLGFLNGSGEWASISGKATVVSDREAVRKHYSPALKAWLGDLGDGKHDGGPEDPRIVLIRVDAKTAQYAINRKNFIANTLDMAKGVITGETPSTHRIGYISDSEFEQVRAG